MLVRISSSEDDNIALIDTEAACTLELTQSYNTGQIQLIISGHKADMDKELGSDSSVDEVALGVEVDLDVLLAALHSLVPMVERARAERSARSV